MTLEELYKKNRRHYAFKLNRHLNNFARAEDVVQEAFCKALTSMHTFDQEKGSLATWFNKVLYSVLWSEVRRDKNQPTMIDIDVVLDSPDLAYDMSISLKDYILNVTNKEHKEVLFAFYILGYKLPEISGCLGLTESNVRKIIQRFQPL